MKSNYLVKVWLMEKWAWLTKVGVASEMFATFLSQRLETMLVVLYTDHWVINLQHMHERVIVVSLSVCLNISCSERKE